MPKRLIYAVFTLALGFILLCCTQDREQPGKAAVTEDTTETDTSPVVAEIGSEKITLNQLDRAIKRLPLPYQERFRTGEGRKYILDDLITVNLLSREAERLGLDQKPEVKAQLASIRRRILSAELLRTELTKKPDPEDEEIRQYYELNKKQFTLLEKAKIRKIVVRSLEEGKKILKALREGEDFTQLAKERSIDPSKAKGGYIGWLSRDQMKPDLIEVVSNLEKGAVNGLIRTEKGYAVILVEDKKMSKPMEYEQVRPAIIQRLKAEKEAKVLNRLRAKLFKEMNVKVHEDRLTQEFSSEDKR